MKVIVQSLPHQFGQFKPNGSPGLPLPDSRSVNGIAIGRHVIHAQGDEITAAKFAVDGQIEHRQVAGALLELQFRAYRPNMAWPHWWLRAGHFTLVPGRPTSTWRR